MYVDVSITMISFVNCLHTRANTLLSILVCVFEALAALFTLFRSIQALRFGGSALAAKRHTFSYLVVEQGRPHDDLPLTPMLTGNQGVLYLALISAFTIGATVLNFRAPGGFFQRLLNAITLP